MHVSNSFDRSNDTKELNKLVAVMLELAITDIKEQGVNPLIVETYRSQIRQNYLYCQGRTVTMVTSKGISNTFAKTYCSPKTSKVTWTLNSVHKLRKAVDIVPQREVEGKKTAIWDTKDPQTIIIIDTMQKYGFEAGVNWVNNPDSPHFQVNGTFGNVFKQDYTTTYVTEAIQKALNEKVKAKLIVDGIWGEKTTKAVNSFRKQQGYKTAFGQIGAVALKTLFQ